MLVEGVVSLLHCVPTFLGLAAILLALPLSSMVLSQNRISAQAPVCFINKYTAGLANINACWQQLCFRCWCLYSLTRFARVSLRIILFQAADSGGGEAREELRRRRSSQAGDEQKRERRKGEGGRDKGGRLGEQDGSKLFCGGLFGTQRGGVLSCC